MQAITGAWTILPDIPWVTHEGTSYKELGEECTAILKEIRAGYPGADPLALAYLAERVNEMSARLTNLGSTELAVDEIVAVTERRCRERRPGQRPRHLRDVSARP